MPIYDLKCKKCEKIFRDVLRSVKADPNDEVCPSCGNKGMQRQPCRVHARFCGPGFSTKKATKTAKETVDDSLKW